VLDRSEGSSTRIPIHAEPHHQIVPLFRLGTAQRTTPEPLDAGPEITVLPLDLLGVCLPPRGRHGLHRPRLDSPAVGTIAQEAPGGPPCLECQTDRVLPSSTPIRDHLARVVIQGVP
jgi:hypothetical protein